MKKILVPTDFSGPADKALNYAVGIAKGLQAGIILLHCLDHKDAAAHSEEKIMETLNKYKKEILQEHNIEVTVRIAHSKLVEEVCRSAEQEAVTLIVMGTQGASGFKTALFGTKTAGVIAKTTVPVIAIPFDYDWKEPKRFLIAISDAHEGMEIFQPVTELAHAFKAQLKTIVFSKEKEEGVQIMEHSRAIAHIQHSLGSVFKDSEVEQEHLSGKDLHDTLQVYINDHNTDLLVMITHKKTFFQNLLQFSATRQMSYHTTVPLLSLHAAEHRSL